MAYQLFYGNPYAGNVGGALMDAAENKETFARRVENAKLRLERDRVQIERARLRLAKTQEERQREQFEQDLEFRRDQLADRAAEFAQAHGLNVRQEDRLQADLKWKQNKDDRDDAEKLRNEINRLRGAGFKIDESGRALADGEVEQFDAKNRRWIGEDPKAKERRDDVNELRAKGFVLYAGDGADLNEGETVLAGPDGTRWRGNTDAARQIEVARATREITADSRYDDAAKQEFRDNAQRLDNVLARRSQAQKDLEEYEKDATKLRDSITRLEERDKLSSGQQKALTDKRRALADLEAKRPDLAQYDAQEKALLVRNAMLKAGLPVSELFPMTRVAETDWAGLTDKDWVIFQEAARRQRADVLAAWFAQHRRR